MKGLFLLIGLALVCDGCHSASESKYLEQIASERLSKDATFKGQAEPIPNALKGQLLPLVYYPPNPRYEVLGVLTPSRDSTTLQMVYSDGAIRDVRRVGTLEFSLDGARYHLVAFVEVGAPDQNSMFIPFADSTNGTETYHGGRMLEVRRTTNDLYFLDFNRAFNPFCYYSPAYSCPLAPKENRLPIAIHAGEKIKVQQFKAASLSQQTK